MIFLFVDALLHALIYFFCIVFISFLSYMFLCVKDKKQIQILEEYVDFYDE